LPSIGPLDKIYWLRFAAGVGAGILCGLLKLTDMIGLTFGIGGYTFTYYLVRHILKVGLDEVESEWRFYTIGIGAYFLTWFALWTLLHTLSVAGIF